MQTIYIIYIILPFFKSIFSRSVIYFLSSYLFSRALYNIDFLLETVKFETLFRNKIVFSQVKDGYKLFIKYWHEIEKEYNKTYEGSMSYMYETENQQDICDTIVSMVNKELYILLTQLKECNNDKIYVLCHSYAYYKLTDDRECYDILCRWVDDEIKPEEEIDVAIVSQNLDFCDYIGARRNINKSDYHSYDAVSRYLYQEITREKAELLLLEERELAIKTIDGIL